MINLHNISAASINDFWDQEKLCSAGVTRKYFWGLAAHPSIRRYMINGRLPMRFRIKEQVWGSAMASIWKPVPEDEVRITLLSASAEVRSALLSRVFSRVRLAIHLG